MPMKIYETLNSTQMKQFLKYKFVEDSDLFESGTTKTTINRLDKNELRDLVSIHNENEIIDFLYSPKQKIKANRLKNVKSKQKMKSKTQSKQNMKMEEHCTIEIRNHICPLKKVLLVDCFVSTPDTCFSFFDQNKQFSVFGIVDIPQSTMITENIFQPFKSGRSSLWKKFFKKLVGVDREDIDQQADDFISQVEEQHNVQLDFILLDKINAYALGKTKNHSLYILGCEEQEMGMDNMNSVLIQQLERDAKDLVFVDFEIGEQLASISNEEYHALFEAANNNETVKWLSNKFDAPKVAIHISLKK